MTKQIEEKLKEILEDFRGLNVSVSLGSTADRILMLLSQEREEVIASLPSMALSLTDVENWKDKLRSKNE